MGSGVQTPTVATLGAAQAACVAQVDGAEGVMFAVAAGLVGTITFEGSVDGVTFFPLPAFGTTAGAATAGAFVNPGAQLFYVAGGPALKTVQCRCSAYSSGSAVVTGVSDDNGTASLVPTIAIGAAPAGASASQVGAFTKYRYKSAAASDNLVSVAAGAHNIQHLIVGNMNAALRYLKLYDKATAPILASDTPVATIVLPATSMIPVPYDSIRFGFALGIAHAIVTSPVDATSGNTGADEVFLTLLYG